MAAIGDHVGLSEHLCE